MENIYKIVTAKYLLIIIACEDRQRWRWGFVGVFLKCETKTKRKIVRYRTNCRWVKMFMVHTQTLYENVYKSSIHFRCRTFFFFFLLWIENASICHYGEQSSQWITVKNVKLFWVQLTVKKKQQHHQTTWEVIHKWRGKQTQQKKKHRLMSMTTFP